MEAFWAIDAYKRQNRKGMDKKGIISSEVVNKALAIVFNAQKEQADKNGRPSILRTFHIAEQLQGELPICAALLSDANNNGVTIEELSAAGFSEAVIAIARILSWNHAVDFLEYYQRIKDSGNIIAINIALTGLLFDCDLSRIRNMDTQAVEWYYQCIQAIAVLESENNKTHWRDGDMEYIYNAMTTRTIDIKSDAPSIGGRLSNLHARAFVFCGIECGSIEGVLQSFKHSDPIQQYVMCKLYGFEAKKAGKNHDWKALQTLYWMSKAFPRGSSEYQQLLNSLYKAAYDQSKQFREDLGLSKGYKLLHSMGSDDPTQTILTRNEFISRLEWLRDMIADV